MRSFTLLVLLFGVAAAGSIKDSREKLQMLRALRVAKAVKAPEGESKYDPTPVNAANPCSSKDPQVQHQHGCPHYDEDNKATSDWHCEQDAQPHGKCGAFSASAGLALIIALFGLSAQ